MKKRSLFLMCVMVSLVSHAISQTRMVQGIPHPTPLSTRQKAQQPSLRSDPTFTFDDIKYWVGEGENRAALVIEWHDGKSPDAIVWGYKWNGNACGLDMITAIANADPRLIFLRQFTGPMGYTIDGLGYNCPVGSISYDLEGAKTDDRVSFKFQLPYKMPNQTGHPDTPAEDVLKALETGYRTGVIDHPFNASVYGYACYDYDYWKCLSGTHWDAGWYDGYWSYWVRDAQTEEFVYSGLGASSRQLVDGSWDGWSYLRDMSIWTGAELGDYFTAAINPNAISVTKVTLDKSTLTLPVSDTYQLIPTIIPTNADNKNVTWESSEETVATVNNQGLVTAVASGTTNITVRTEDGGFTAVCQVTVTNPVSVSGVMLDMATLQLETGKKQVLTATVKPENADNKNVTWESSEEAIATVNARGLVTAVAPGKAQITVKTEDGDFTAICEVTVTSPLVSVTGISLDMTKLQLQTGKTKMLTATVEPENAHNKNVVWESSQESVATVNNQGLVTAVSAGTTNIIVRTENSQFRALCKVTVTPPAASSVTGVTLNKTDITLQTGETEALRATVQPENATNKELTWKSSEESVATVNNQGLVKAIAAGKAEITVTTEDGGHTAVCNVTVNIAPGAVKGVVLDKKEIRLQVGKTQTLTATVQPDNANNQSVTWKSSDETIATVSDQGVVSAVAVGKSQITVTTEDGGYTAMCEVIVIPTEVQPKGEFPNDSTMIVSFKSTEGAFFYDIEVYKLEVGKKIRSHSFRIDSEGKTLKSLRTDAIEDISFTLKGLENKSKYSITINAIDKTEKVIATYEPLEITTPTGILPNLPEKSISVSNNMLRITGMAHSHCRIYSINGVLMDEFHIGDVIAYHTLHLPSGIYLLQVVEQQNVSTYKFIIN